MQTHCAPEAEGISKGHFSVKQARGSPIVDLSKPGKKTLLSTRNRVLLAFMWLRLYWCYTELVLVFGVNESYVSRKVRHIIPIIYWVYRPEIRWPTEENRELLEGTLADVDEDAIRTMDITITPRHHSIFFDEQYYRDDKGRAFLNNFGVVDFRGLWMECESGYRGRALDQRAFVLSDVGSGEKPVAKKKKKKQKILADCGFTTEDRVLTPHNKDNETSRKHKAHRCGIETNFRDLKLLRALQAESCHGPAFQAIYAAAGARLCNHLWRKCLSSGLAIFSALTSDINI